MKPLIGITTGEIVNHAHPWSPITYGQSHTYSDSIIRCGGLPVLIPLTSDMGVLRQLFDKLDGILFAGGNDIDPARYGQVASPETKDVSTMRDDVETSLMQWSVESKKPVFAICRGFQLLNVVRGGTLYQHIPTDVASASDHEQSSVEEDGQHIAHHVRLQQDSQIAGYISSTSINANTHHHQAIKDLGDGLTAVGWSEDSIVEAVEDPNLPYLLGVQCHPESLLDVEPKWGKLFASFVKAAAAE